MVILEVQMTRLSDRFFKKIYGIYYFLGTAIRGCANLIDWLESSGAMPISFTVCHSFRVHIQLFIDVDYIYFFSYRR